MFALVPALPGGLSADPEPVADLGPRVAEPPEPDHGVLDRGLQVAGGADHSLERFNVPVADSTGVRAHDAASEPGVLVVLDDFPAPVS